MRAVRAAAGLTALAIIAAGCGGGYASPAAKPRPAVRAEIGGLPLQQARCVQWRAGTPAQRAAVVRALAGVVGGPTGTGRGGTLTEGQAFELFDRACASRVARHFLLYELYTRAAGFRTLGSPPPTRSVSRTTPMPCSMSSATYGPRSCGRTSAIQTNRVPSPSAKT